MNELEEVLNEYQQKDRKYNKEEWIEYKKKEKQEVYELIDKTAKKIITKGDEFKKYLDVQGQFKSYSVGNALLVTAQSPESTILRDYDGWNKLGIYLKNKPKEIKILEPADEYMREDGSIGINYNVKKVYNEKQTTRNIKTRKMKYDNNILMKMFLNGSNSSFKIVDEIPNSDKKALYDNNQDILYIARGAEAPDIFYEVSKELAKQEIGDNSSLDEFKSYCVSYMLCSKYNIDVSNYKFLIPEELKKMDAKEIRNELEPIRDALDEIDTSINVYFKKIILNNQNER